MSYCRVSVSADIDFVECHWLIQLMVPSGILPFHTITREILNSAKTSLHVFSAWSTEAQVQ
jgi:hypothetical protein